MNQRDKSKTKLRVLKSATIKEKNHQPQNIKIEILKKSDCRDKPAALLTPAKKGKRFRSFKKRKNTTLHVIIW